MSFGQEDHQVVEVMAGRRANLKVWKALQQQTNDRRQTQFAGSLTRLALHLVERNGCADVPPLLPLLLGDGSLELRGCREPEAARYYHKWLEGNKARYVTSRPQRSCLLRYLRHLAADAHADRLMAGHQSPVPAHLTSHVSKY